MQLRSVLKTAFDGKVELFEDRASELDWYRKKLAEAKRQLAFLPGYIEDLAKMIDRLEALDDTAASSESEQEDSEEGTGRYKPWKYIHSVLQKNSRLLKEKLLPELIRAEGARLADRDPESQVSKSVTQNSKLGNKTPPKFFRVGEYVGLYEWRSVLERVQQMLEGSPAPFENAVAYGATLTAGGMGVLQVRILLESAIEAGVLVKNGDMVGPGLPIPPNPPSASE